MERLWVARFIAEMEPPGFELAFSYKRLYLTTLLQSRLAGLPAKPPHPNPPLPFFKMPPAQWAAVLQRVAQGESLRQIARSYNTSFEAVRRVVLAARHKLLGREGEPVTLLSKDAEEEPSKE